MTIFRYIALFAATAALFSACVQEEAVEFAIDSDKIEIGAEGGTRNLKVSISGKWIASSNVPWITVSPTNGNGSETCTISIDSSVVFSSVEPVRTGVIRIQESDTWENREITVTQKNFPYSLTVEDGSVNIPNFKEPDERWFDVKVVTNSDFRVDVSYTEDIEQGIVGNWLEVSDHTINLDRGARPRTVTLRFKWGINSVPYDRLAEVNFIPVNAEGEDIPSDEFETLDILNVIQSQAEQIEIGRQGDSISLVNIARTLNVWTSWDTAEPMSNWDNVELWETNDDRNGRVRYARFFMFNTSEGIPFEVQYLTAAEELVFYANENTFLRKGIEPGPYILKLKDNLKRLTIAAYGLDYLPEDFKGFSKLEYLDLSSNNFTEVPSVLTPENFPALRSLELNNNQRRLVYDISNVNIEESKFAEQYGGLYNENNRAENQVGDDSKKDGLPIRLLRWNLDTLSLSLNYLQGDLPSDDDLKNMGFPTYTDTDYAGVDTLWTGLKDREIPKLLTNTKKFCINLNRFSGELPQWLLYHPNLDLWDPFILMFTQEGKDIHGNSAVFSNAPDNLDYYYELDGYSNKYYSPTRPKE